VVLGARNQQWLLSGGITYCWQSSMCPCVSILALRADINIHSVWHPCQFDALVHLQVHVFDHKFATDFYGKYMNVLICGFLRYAFQGPDRATSAVAWILLVSPVCPVLTARHSRNGCAPPCFATRRQLTCWRLVAQCGVYRGTLLHREQLRDAIAIAGRS
jgi:hypothetical protein